MDTYWNNNGKYQEWSDKLDSLVPACGKAKELHIDLFRNIGNCYYDHYNNGNCNWDNKREQFANIEYNADELAEAAQVEGVDDIRKLLAGIRSILDNDCEDDYSGEDDARLENNWEKLTDIITRYAWQVETSKETA